MMLESFSGNSYPIVERSHNEALYYVNRNYDVNYILDISLEEARRIVKAREGSYYLYDERGRLLGYPMEEDDDDLRQICQDCILTRSPLNAWSQNGQLMLDGGVPLPYMLSTSILCIPLDTDDGNMGALVMRKPLYYDRFFDDDLNILRQFASAFTVLLRSSWRNDQDRSIFLEFKAGLHFLLSSIESQQNFKTSDYQLRSVLDVSNLINSSRQLDEMIQAVLYSARKVLRAENASLFMKDEATGELYFDIISGNEPNNLKGVRVPPGQGIVGLCAQKRQPIIVNDAMNDPRIYRAVDDVSGIRTRNLIAVPLLVDGEVIGVLEVLNTVERSSFSSHDVNLFQSFADSVAIALQRRLLLDDLQRTNSQLGRKLRETTSLHTVAAALVEAQSFTELSERVLKIIHHDQQVRYATIYSVDNSDEMHLSLVASSGFEGHGSEAFLFFEVVAKKLLSSESPEPLFLPNLLSSQSYGSIAFEHGVSCQSLTMVPLQSGEDNPPFGILLLTDPQGDRGNYDEDDYRLFLTIASQLVRGYESFKLTEELIKREGIQKEVEITSRIQRNILPTHSPSHDLIELAARSVMAKTTGGDFYDYFVHQPNGDVSFLVADVAGKSLPAALFMAISSSILRTIARDENDPTSVLQKANALLYEESQSGMFVTVFFSRYEPSTGKLYFASAGHNEMLLVHSDGSYELLSGKGMPLGVILGDGKMYAGGEICLQRGDILVLYTDGVSEAINDDNEEFGLDRFIEQVVQLRDLPAEEIVEKIYQSVLDFSGNQLQYDDFTMLVTRFMGTVEGMGNYSITLPIKRVSVPSLRDFVALSARRHGISGDLLSDLLLVCDEAATNIVMHSRENDEAAIDDMPNFHFRLKIESGRFVFVEFRDSGCAFEMDERLRPDLAANLDANLRGERKGGFGLYLMRSLMDSVEYLREGDENILRMEKNLQK